MEQREVAAERRRRSPGRGDAEGRRDEAVDPARPPVREHAQARPRPHVRVEVAHRHAGATTSVEPSGMDAATSLAHGPRRARARRRSRCPPPRGPRRRRGARTRARTVIAGLDPARHGGRDRPRAPRTVVRRADGDPRRLVGVHDQELAGGPGEREAGARGRRGADLNEDLGDVPLEEVGVREQEKARPERARHSGARGGFGDRRPAEASGELD